MGLPEKKPSKHSSIRFVQQPNAKERQLERLLQRQAALNQQIEKLQSREGQAPRMEESFMNEVANVLSDLQQEASNAHVPP